MEADHSLSRRARETRARRVDAERMLAVITLALAGVAASVLGAVERDAASLIKGGANLNDSRMTLPPGAANMTSALGDGDEVAKLGYGYYTAGRHYAGLYNSYYECPPSYYCHRPFYDWYGRHQSRPKYRVHTYYWYYHWWYGWLRSYYWTGYYYDCPTGGACVDCAGYNSNYDNSHCTGQNVCGRGTITNKFIITRRPEGYGADQCSTWSQTKECTVTCDAPTVTFRNSQNTVSSNTFDFKVELMQEKMCPDGNCLTSTASTKERVHCDVKIHRKGEPCQSYGKYMPCLEWENFVGVLALTDADGMLVTGSFTIDYLCRVVSKPGDYKYSTYGEEVVSTQTQASYDFEVVNGCNPTMPIGGVDDAQPNAELAKLFLLGSNEFVQAPCASIADTKETVFRLFDKSPMDGLLTYEELIAAAKDRSIDAHIITLWNSIEPVRLSLGQVMQSDVKPLTCPQSSGEEITFGTVVYPSSESGRETTALECETNARRASGAWTYGVSVPPGTVQGENVCAYVDGVLFEEHEPSLEPPLEKTRYKKLQSTNKYTLSQIDDSRPVSGGLTEVQSFMAAQFTFDGIRLDGNSIASNVPLSGDQKIAPTLQIPSGGNIGVDVFDVCMGTKGGYCMNSKPGGVKYVGDAFDDGGFAFSTWISFKTGHQSQGTIISLSGTSGQDEHELTMRLGNAEGDEPYELTVDYSVTTGAGADASAFSQTPVKRTVASIAQTFASSASQPSNSAYTRWFLIGFTYTNKGGVTIFIYPADVDEKYVKQDKSWPKDKLAFMPNIVLFNTQSAAHYQVDDVRLYTGDLDRSTFVSARSCGRKGYCANRARATPMNRRVLCVYINKKSSIGRYSCAGMMYYDGTVIDLKPDMDLSGVVFSFRDTSWEETSFEIERKVYGATEKFDTVILVQGDLKACAAKFSSITYIDRDASTTPNSQWLYRVTTKRDRVDEDTGLSYVISSSYHFTTPWITVITGRVLAGASASTVPHVRICAEFDTFLANGRPSRASSLFIKRSNSTTLTNLAQFKRVSHSNADRAHTSYLVTDNSLSSGSVSLDKGEHVVINLGAWTTVGKVRVCMSTRNGDFEPADIAAFVQEHESLPASETHGHACSFSEYFHVADENRTCADYACKGMKVNVFHGQYVTVKASSSASLRNVTEIQVYGNETRCTYTSVTDKDGQYDLSIKDTTGVLPLKAVMHIGAYKEEIMPRTHELLLDSSLNSTNTVLSSKSQPRHILLALAQVVGNPGEADDNDVHQFTDADADDSQDVSRSEFLDFLSDIVNFGSDSTVIVDDNEWQSLDWDSDDVLNVTEFQAAAILMAQEKLVVRPIIVYPVLDTKHLYHFRMSQTADDARNALNASASAAFIRDDEACEHMILIRRQSATPPFGDDEWLNFYKSIRALGDAQLESCRPLSSTSETVFNAGDATLASAIPVMISKPGASNILLHKTAAIHHAESDITGRAPFNRATRDRLRIRLHAAKQLPDIVHVFDQVQTGRGSQSARDQNETEINVVERIFSDAAMTKRTTLDVKHKLIEEKDFSDDTTTVVRGAVLFPESAVEGSRECGLSRANIEVFEAEGEPEYYLTDESGWFEFALTRGKTFTIRANLAKHSICYSGNTIESAMDNHDCEGDLHEVTIPNIADGNFVFFTDVTKTNIDLGVYMGECLERYDDTTFKVVPVNGCHAAVLVTKNDIERKWKTTSSPTADGVPTSEWPFAAMDYSVSLVSAPTTNGVMELIADEAWSDGCATEQGDMVSYFRSRNTLERLMTARDTPDLVQIRYKYHGFLCVEIMNVPKIDSATEKCYYDAEPAGGLSRKHFVGVSQYDSLSSLSASKNLEVQVFELHLKTFPDGRIAPSKCFERLPNEANKTGHTKLSYRQDVSDEGDNECHPNRGGGPMCDFDVVVDGATGFVNFPIGDNQMTLSTEIVAGKPNLAGNHRRSVDIAVERFDGFKSVTVKSRRSLISLGSKPRGGGGMSDDVFWATTPIEGLVYTVVHDPPGGDSYAELAIGSSVAISFDLTGTRMASTNIETKSKTDAPVEIDIYPGFSAGWVAEGSLTSEMSIFTLKAEMEMITSGPTVEMNSVNRSGWALETSTDRVIRSSQDASLAGRPGDVILGGGIELVYKLSDVLDIINDGRTLNKPCLLVSVEITWLPRKPTSFLFGVASIESQVIPNLQFLLSVVMDGGIAKDDSEMYFQCLNSTGGIEANESVALCAKEEVTMAWTEYLIKSLDVWRRTLAWASPSVYVVDNNGVKEKRFEGIDRVSAAVLDGSSVMRKYFDSKREYFTGEFLQPISEVMDQLQTTWDATFWMMPYNGVGPPAMFGNGKLAFDEVWSLDDRYWESSAADEPGWQVAGMDPPEEEEDSGLESFGKIVLKQTPKAAGVAAGFAPKKSYVTLQRELAKLYLKARKGSNLDGFVEGLVFGGIPKDEMREFRRIRQVKASRELTAATDELTQADEALKKAKNAPDPNDVELEELQKKRDAAKAAADEASENAVNARKAHREAVLDDIAYKQKKAPKMTHATMDDVVLNRQVQLDEANAKVAKAQKDVDDPKFKNELKEKQKMLDDAKDAQKKAKTSLAAAEDTAAATKKSKSLTKLQRGASKAAKLKVKSAADAVEAAQDVRKVSSRADELAEIASDASKKVKGKTAIKVALASVVVGAAVAMSELDDSGYRRISFPRKTMERDIPTFDDEFYDDGKAGVYTWGMLEDAQKDLLEGFQSCEKQDCTQNDAYDTKESMLQNYGDGETPDANVLGELGDLSQEDASRRVVASFTGAKANTGMHVRDQNVSLPHEDQMLLSFSGGGYSTDYSFSTNEATVDGGYELTVSLHGETSNEYETEMGGVVGLVATIAAMVGGIDLEAKNTFVKEMKYDRAFAWNKHGRMSTLYTLGDPHLGDKFVVKVGSDKRFGTPIFTTEGGRSKCPGEPFTVFRESGFELSFDGVQSTTSLNPGERAILRIRVTNESPYRENMNLGLRLVDGLDQSVTMILKTMYEGINSGQMNGKDISALINETASGTLASTSDVVKRIMDDAGTAAARDLSLMDIAAVAVEAAKSAAPVGTEMNDVEFDINKVRMAPIGDLTPLVFVGGDLLNLQRRVVQSVFTLAITPLSDLTQRIRYLTLSVMSKCEFDMWQSANFNRDPIGSTISLGEISWSRRCPAVSFDESTMAKYLFASVSPASPDPVEIVVFNPNRGLLWPSGDASISARDAAITNTNLKLVRLQYRSIHGGEWITAKAADSTESNKKKNLLCPYSRLAGCTFKWDVNNRYEKLLSGFKDGSYEVRVKNFCFGESTMADASVHEYVSDQRLTLSVDTIEPMATSKLEFSSDNTVTIEYPEEIICDEQVVSVKRIVDGSCVTVDEPVSSEVLKSSFTVRCFNNAGAGKWVLRYPPAASGTYRVVLTGVKDLAGNVASRNEFEFLAGDGVMDCAKVICGENFFVDANHKCAPCEKGYAIDAGSDVRGPSNTCNKCAVGYFYDSSTTTCASCGAGYSSVGGTFAQVRTCGVCAPNFYVSAADGDAVTCSECAPGSFSNGGDATICSPTYCGGRDERVLNHECVACPLGALRPQAYDADGNALTGDDMSAGDTLCHVCEANWYFDDSDNACKSCPAGTSNDEGEGGVETCKSQTCDVDHYVSNHACSACPTGYSRAAGDVTTTPSTVCDKCSQSHHVDMQNRCVACDAGYVSLFFSQSLEATRYNSNATTCGHCAANHHVARNARDALVCQKCPVGTVRGENDDVKLNVTQCTACDEGYHVVSNAGDWTCAMCPLGTVPAADETHDASRKMLTNCVARICGLGEKVSVAECVKCPLGMIRYSNLTGNVTGGDDATKGDTECELCAENYVVAGNPEIGYRCAPCEGYGTRVGGDNVTAGIITECQFVSCPANTRVRNHTCEPCEAAYINAKGDDPSAGDTTCQNCANGFHANGWGECVACKTGTVRTAGDYRYGPAYACDAPGASSHLGRRGAPSVESVVDLAYAKSRTVAVDAPFSARRSAISIVLGLALVASALVALSSKLYASFKRGHRNERSAIKTRTPANYGAAV